MANSGKHINVLYVLEWIFDVNLMVMSICDQSDYIWHPGQQVNIKAKIQDKEVSQDSVKAKIQDKEVSQGEPSTLQLGTPLICHNYHVLSSYTTCYGIP